MSSAEDPDSKPWCFTVLRLDEQGLRFLGPDSKSWRPIVTLSVDDGHPYRTVLGCDGQNINLKDTFQVTGVSKVEFKIWHQSQSKKKKKPVFCAGSTVAMNDLIKMCDPKSETFVVRLQRQCVVRKKRSKRNEAVAGLHVRLRPPSYVAQLSSIGSTTSVRHEEEESTINSVDGSSGDEVEYISDQPLPVESARSRPRRRRGYRIDTDDEDNDDASCDESCPSDDLPCTPVEDPYQPAWPSPSDIGTLIEKPESPAPATIGVVEWAASLLPEYIIRTSSFSEQPELTFGERAVASFTVYGQLRDASVDTDFAPIFQQLQFEWSCSMGMLAALAGINAAVFAVGGDSIFGVEVNPAMGMMVAISSIASGTGLACSAWYLFRYSSTDVNAFRARALDVYSSYLFFSLSSRVPGFCMLISAASIMIFLFTVAYGRWPGGVLIFCGLVGMLMTLQFLVYGIDKAVSAVTAGILCIKRGVARLFRRTSPSQPLQGNSELQSAPQ